MWPKVEAWQPKGEVEVGKEKAGQEGLGVGRGTRRVFVKGCVCLCVCVCVCFFFFFSEF